MEVTEAVTVKAIEDRVFVIPDEASQEKAGSILLPFKGDPPNTGTVESCGPLCTAIAAGDRIVFDRQHMRPQSVLGQTKQVIHYRQVYALLVDDA